MSAHAPVLAPATLPWYCQKWPWVLLSGPIVVVVAGLATTYLALRSDDGLVAQDYYKRGLLINRELSKNERAAGVDALATFERDGSVRVRLSGDDPAPPQLRLRVAHPTREGFDRLALLTRSADGTYVGKIMPVATGRWRVTVDADLWRLPSVEVTAPFDALRLRAAADGR